MHSLTERNSIQYTNNSNFIYKIKNQQPVEKQESFKSKETLIKNDNIDQIANIKILST